MAAGDQPVADGVYRNQFETGTSNGGLTARPGGARWRWEQRIFGGAYDDAPAGERPRYGALNHRRHPDFRGARVVRVGEAVAEDGWLDARVIGAAHRTTGHDPQDLKKVWHHVARFGRPAAGGDASER